MALDSRIEHLIDNSDLLEIFSSPDRMEVGAFISALRDWGRYNMMTTDLGPYLTDTKTIIEKEFAVEILDYAKETGEFPVNMLEFMETQPKAVQYLKNSKNKRHND